jgi:hypothetical protein
MDTILAATPDRLTSATNMLLRDVFDATGRIRCNPPSSYRPGVFLSTRTTLYVTTVVPPSSAILISAIIIIFVATIQIVISVSGRTRILLPCTNCHVSTRLFLVATIRSFLPFVFFSYIFVAVTAAIVGRLFSRIFFMLC